MAAGAQRKSPIRRQSCASDPCIETATGVSSTETHRQAGAARAHAGVLDADDGRTRQRRGLVLACRVGNTTPQHWSENRTEAQQQLQLGAASMAQPMSVREQTRRL